jgi:hypothetical protein
MDKYEDKAKSSEQKLDEAKKEIHGLNKKIELMMELDKNAHKRHEIRKHDSKSGNTEAVAFMIGSDWHLDERVFPETVLYSNGYNLNIARKRMDNFFKGGLRLTEIERSGVKIDTLCLALLGDNITGWIHQENRSENSMAPSSAILVAEELLISGIYYLLKNGNFKKIIIPCMCGNHSRLTMQSEYSRPASKTLEWLLYHAMKKEFKEEKRIEFIIPDSDLYIHEFYGRKIRFSHGTRIRFNGGIGGPTISFNKAIDKNNSLIDCYYDVIGHLHTYFNGGNFLINGSGIGYTGFGMGIHAKYEDPSQAFFLIDNNPRHGMTINSRIFVRDESEDYQKIQREMMESQNT